MYTQYIQMFIYGIDQLICLLWINHKDWGNEIFHYRSVAVPPTERVSGMMGDEALEEKVCRF